MPLAALAPQPIWLAPPPTKSSRKPRARSSPCASDHLIDRGHGNALLPPQSEDSVSVTLPFRNAGVSPALFHASSTATQPRLFRIVQDVVPQTLVVMSIQLK